MLAIVKSRLPIVVNWATVIYMTTEEPGISQAAAGSPSPCARIVNRDL